MKQFWTYAFPQVLNGESADKIASNLSGMGINVVSYCNGIYGPYRILNPRYEKYIYALEEGNIFFKPDLSLYGEIKPVVSKEIDIGKFPSLIKECHKNKIKVGSWLTLFANGFIAKNHPKYAIENIYGSADRLFLCYNKKPVREYALSLIKDMITKYEVDYLEMDKIPQTSLEAQSFAGVIHPFIRAVGSICFCSSCQAEAKKRGLNFAEIKKRGKELIDAIRKIPSWNIERIELTGDTGIPSLFLEQPWLYEVMKFRIDCIVDFLKTAKQLIKSKRKDVQTSLILVPPVKSGHDSTSPRVWMGAQSYSRFSEQSDWIHAVIHGSNDWVLHDTVIAKYLANPKCKICTDVKIYGNTSPESLANQIDMLNGTDVDAIGFFSYDLMDEKIMATLKSEIKC